MASNTVIIVVGIQQCRTKPVTFETIGEEIVIPVDPSAGSMQEYVEDCPVCCNPNIIHVEIDEEGDTGSVG